MQEGSQQFWDLWRLFNLDFKDGWAGLTRGIYWPALFEQVPKMTGLFLVVCFGSCMWVAGVVAGNLNRGHRGGHRPVLGFAGPDA